MYEHTVPFSVSSVPVSEGIEFFSDKDINKPSRKIKSTHSRARPTCLCSPSTSQVEGVSPSEPCAQRRPKSDVATAFAAAQDNIVPQHIRHACSARFCKIAVSWRALALANCDTNDLVSSDQRPPTSIASTTSLARERGRPIRGMCVLCVSSQTATPPRQHPQQPMWGPIAVESANEGRVHSQLTTPKQWKAVNNDLQSTAVRQVRRSQVHVPNQHICCHTSTSFAAHACCRTLQRISPPSQNPRPST